MLNLHRDKKIVRRETGRDGKILSDHRQDGNDEVHRLKVRFKKKKKKKRPVASTVSTMRVRTRGSCTTARRQVCCTGRLGW